MSFYGWINAAMLFFIYLSVLGFVFLGYSAIFPAMIKSTGWARGDASSAQTISMVIAGLLYPIMVYMLNRFGAQAIITTGLFIMTIGLFLLGTVVDKLWTWILVWGLIMPFGNVSAGIVPIQTTVVHWFNIKRSTVLGLVLTGGAIGGFISQPLYTGIIENTGRWQTGWLVAAFIVSAAFLVSFFVRSKPSDMGQHPDGHNPKETGARTKSKAGIKTYRTKEDWTFREIVRTPAVWLIVTIIAAYIMPCIMMFSHGALHIIDLGYTRMQAASVLMITFLISGAVRFPAGWLGDRIEPRWIISGALALQLLTFIGIWKGFSIAWLMIIGPLFGVCYGSIVVIIPSIISSYFGSKNFATVNGLTMPFMIFFSGIIPIGAGYLSDITGSYDIAFTILSITLFTGSVAGAFLRPPQKKGAKTQAKIGKARIPGPARSKAAAQ